MENGGLAGEQQSSNTVACSFPRPAAPTHAIDSLCLFGKCLLPNASRPDACVSFGMIPLSAFEP